jgi:hypothetical protein
VLRFCVSSLTGNSEGQLATFIAKFAAPRSRIPAAMVKNRAAAVRSPVLAVGATTRQHSSHFSPDTIVELAALHLLPTSQGGGNKTKFGELIYL